MKWILGAVTLAVMVAAGLLAPERKRVAVPFEAAPEWQETGPAVVLASARQAVREVVDVAAQPTRYRGEISEREAVEIALRRGEEIAAARAAEDAPSAARETQATLPDAGQTTKAEADPPAKPAGLWRVTAARVNLRGGPGTGHPIVGGVARGDLLEPVSGLGSSWVEVTRPAGGTAWIYADFLIPAGG